MNCKALLYSFNIFFMNSQLSIPKNKNLRLITILVTASALLLTPLIAMQFTREVNWTAVDFIAAAVLLFGTGLVCEFVMRKVKNIGYRVIICGAILVVLFLVWAELAVGIFGTPLAGS